MSVNTGQPVRGQALDQQRLFAAFIGAGVAALVVAPAGTTHLTFPGACNLAASRNSVAGFTCVRNGAGDHTVTFAKFATPTAILAVTPVLNGDTAKLYVKVVSWAITSGQLVVQVKATIDDGTATDLAATDRLVLAIDAADSAAMS